MSRQAIIFYRVISFILFPAGCIIFLLSLTGLLASLSQASSAMLVFAVMTATSLYIFSSFHFMIKSKKQFHEDKAIFKKSHIDFIKVNAYVAVFFSALALLNIFMILSNPKTINLVYSQMLNAQPEYASFNKDLLFVYIHWVLIFLMIVSSLLLIHIKITFKLIKEAEFTE